MNDEAIESLAWEKMGGQLPAIVQDAETLQCLMLGYMTRAALAQTLAEGRVCFFSRSKQRLWVKGESSGNFLELVELQPDCDGDALLVRARPRGPTCHRETTSCFGSERAPGVGFLARLAQVVRQRNRERPEGSYTSRLFEAGVHRQAQKVGEEGVEVALAAKDAAVEPLLAESADLLFHLLVLLEGRGVGLDEVVAVLKARHRE